MKTRETASEDKPVGHYRQEMTSLWASLCRAAGVLALLALAAMGLVLVIFMVQTGGKWGVISGGFVAAFTAVTVLALAPRRDN